MLDVDQPSTTSVADNAPAIPATQDDLDWWLAVAPRLDWTWASTYANTAPHWYVVAGRTPGLLVADYVRAGRVIRTFGEPGKYWSMTNLYLFTTDRRLKFWCMWGSPPNADEDSTLINMAMTDRSYGEQSDFDRARLAELRLPESLDTGARASSAPSGGRPLWSTT